MRTQLLVRVIVWAYLRGGTFKRYQEECNENALFFSEIKKVNS